MKEYDSTTPEEVLLAQIRLDASEASDAFAQLLTRYVWLIRQRTYAVQSSAVESEDLYQEGLIGLYDAARTYDSARQTKFSTYAGVCISHRIAYAIRAQSSPGNRVLLSAQSLDESQLGEIADDFDVLVNSREKLDTVFTQITGELSQLERNIFMMYLCGYSRAQIAKRAHVTLHGYDNAMQRVRKKLKQESSCF